MGTGVVKQSCSGVFFCRELMLLTCYVLSKYVRHNVQNNEIIVYFVKIFDRKSIKNVYFN